MKVIRKIIGSFEAKTHLSKLIDNVQNGSEYIITKRGKPAAKLIPIKLLNNDLDIDYIISQFEKIRNSVKGKVDVRKMVQEGRKYR